jgi:hypothetical protein
LQQSVWVLPATKETERAVERVLARLRSEGAQAGVLNISIQDPQQEKALVDEFQAERTDEYGEVVERTKQFHAELAMERRRGRATYTELEESEADLDRHERWLAAIRARDYFYAPGAQEAAAAVEACRAALAEFEAEALERETSDFEGGAKGARPALRSVAGAKPRRGRAA